MIWATIIAGLSLGLVGSFHCVGMCGPLALALPVHQLSIAKKIISLLLYQFGRITIYAALGFLFGLLGRRLYIAGLQQWLSVGLGIFVLITATIYFLGKTTIHFKILNKFYLAVQKMIGKLLQSGRKFPTFFLMGMANGLLPCGMIYMAIAGALSSGSISHSITFMAFFGAGTLPAMMAISYFGQSIPMSMRTSMQKAVPYFITAMGIILILRGLNLDIPFISPVLPAAAGDAVSCHS